MTQQGQPQQAPQFEQAQQVPQYGQPQYSQPQYSQPQYPQYPQQPGYGQPKPSEPGKGMATASLVLGILSFFCFAYVSGILGIIFGIVAKNKGYKGKSATAGIICGAVGIVLNIILSVVGISLMAMLEYY
jgi:hypothetical protein